MRRLTGMAYGGDYNPEQWDRDVWARDVELMRDAGVNLATIGVFSWALLEPQRGAFAFGWLDDVLDMLHDAGIQVDLATATASPPPWLTTAHPEMLPVTADGTTLWPGKPLPGRAPSHPRS
jgi:beta-galactosidase